MIKFHNNHIVVCGRCDCILLNSLSHRIVGGERTTWYKCINCTYSFRCCSKIMPTHLKSVRSEINKLQKQLDKLMGIENRRNRGGIKGMNKDVKRMEDSIKN